MRIAIRRLTAVGSLSCILALAGCQTPAVETLPPATAQPIAQLSPSAVDYVPAGSVLVWRNLNDGGTLEEHVSTADGQLYQGSIGSRRSFWYVPDPWADNENTAVADMAPLFPLQVGKQATFSRHPGAGKMTDVVTVVRSETLQLSLGAVDTFVIDTVSKLDAGGWIGHATVWYAPTLHSVVQLIMHDTAGDNRRRQLIEIRKP